jgi:hypothetical protein
MGKAKREKRRMIFLILIEMRNSKTKQMRRRQEIFWNLMNATVRR